MDKYNDFLEYLKTHPITKEREIVDSRNHEFITKLLPPKKDIDNEAQNDSDEKTELEKKEIFVKIVKEENPPAHKNWIYTICVIEYYNFNISITTKEKDKGQVREKVRKIVTGSEDCTIRLFNTESLACERSVQVGSQVFNVAEMKRSGKTYLVGTTWAGRIVVWEFPQFSKVYDIPIIDDANSVIWRTVFVGRESVLCCVCEGRYSGSLILCKIKDEELEKGYFVDNVDEDLAERVYFQTEGVVCMEVLKSNSNIVVFSGGDLLGQGGKDFVLKFIDCESKELVKVFRNGHVLMVNVIKTFICRNSGKEKILSGGSDKFLIMWDLDGNILNFFPLDETVYDILLINSYFLIVGGGTRKDLPFGGNIMSINVDASEVLKYTDYNESYCWSMDWTNPNKSEFVSCFGNELRKFSIGNELLKLVEKDLHTLSKRDEKERIKFIATNLENLQLIRVILDNKLPFKVPKYLFIISMY